MVLCAFFFVTKMHVLDSRYHIDCVSSALVQFLSLIVNPTKVSPPLSHTLGVSHIHPYLVQQSPQCEITLRTLNPSGSRVLHIDLQSDAPCLIPSQLRVSCKVNYDS